MTHWRYTIGHLPAHLLMWVALPQTCLRNYSAFRGAMYRRFVSWHYAAEFTLFGLDGERFASYSFAREMSAAWGKDDSWLDRYKSN